MNYYIARDGQTLGVWPEDVVRQKLSQGELKPDDLCWTEGMADWSSLGSHWQVAGPPPIPQNPYGPPASIPQTPAAPPPSTSDLASIAERLGAACLDALTLFLPALLCSIPAVNLRDGDSELAGLWTMVGVLSAFGVLVYNIVLLSNQGQTLGKKWTNIRIVSYEDGSNPGFLKACFLRGFVNGLISTVCPIYPIADLGFIFREDHRCLHDQIAGTKVVRVTS